MPHGADWILVAILVGFAVSMWWSFRVTTPFFYDVQPEPAPKPAPKPAGPYRVAGEVDPIGDWRKAVEWSDEFRRAYEAHGVDRRVAVALLDLVEAMKRAGITYEQAVAALSSESEATPQIVARTVVSPPNAPVRETVLHLSPAAAKGLTIRCELPGAGVSAEAESEAATERDEAGK